MMAVAPTIEVVRRTPIYQDRKYAGLGIDAELKSSSGTLVRASSIHGIVEAHPDLKQDSDERIMQSQVLLDLHDGYEHPAVIGGDFNILRDTQSIRMLRRGGFINLINAWDIETTRNHFAWDRFPDNPQLDADYVFINPYATVEGFEVLPDEISDHLALRVNVS
jgi:endonuclease/exonuclease/phosphatase family metal-dependent hydrolase